MPLNMTIDTDATLTTTDREAQDGNLILTSMHGKQAKSDKDFTIESISGERTSLEDAVTVELSVEQKEEHLSQSNLTAPSIQNDAALASQGVSIHSLQTEDIDVAAKLSILTTQDISLYSSVSIPSLPAEQDNDEGAVTLETARNMVPQEDDVTLEQKQPLLLRHRESITANPVTNTVQEQEESVTVESKSPSTLQDDDVIIPFIPSRHGSLKSDMSIPMITIDVTDANQS